MKSRYIYYNPNPDPNPSPVRRFLIISSVFLMLLVAYLILQERDSNPPVHDQSPSTMRTVTAIGFWSGGEVTVTGVIDGRHDVWGGTDKTGDGLFAESFTFDNTEPDAMATIYRAIAAQYYN